MMKKFDIDVFLNGKVTFEVYADNRAEAKSKVDEVLNNSTLKELLQKDKSSLEVEMKFDKNKDMER